MPARPMLPGVPAAGHIASNGAWHPGRIDGCVKCPAPPPDRRHPCKCSHPAHGPRCPACSCRTYRPIRSSR